MGGAVQAVTSIATAPINAISNAVGMGDIVPTPKPIQPLTPPPSLASASTSDKTSMPTSTPGADVVRQRQERIRRSEGLRSGATGTTANILTGVKGDTSLTETNKKNLLGS